MGVPRTSTNYGKFSILLNRNKWKAQGHGHRTNLRRFLLMLHMYVSVSNRKLSNKIEINVYYCKALEKMFQYENEEKGTWSK